MGIQHPSTHTQSSCPGKAASWLCIFCPAHRTLTNTCTCILKHIQPSLSGSSLTSTRSSRIKTMCQTRPFPRALPSAVLNVCAGAVLHHRGQGVSTLTPSFPHDTSLGQPRTKEEIILTYPPTPLTSQMQGELENDAYKATRLRPRAGGRTGMKGHWLLHLHGGGGGARCMFKGKLGEGEDGEGFSPIPCTLPRPH